MNLNRLARVAIGKPVAIAALLLIATFAGPSPWSPANAFAQSPIVPDSTALSGITWRIDPYFVCSGDSVRVVVTACTCNIQLESLTRVDSTHVEVHARIQPDIVCAACNPDSLSLTLGPFPVGPAAIYLNMVATLEFADGHTENVSGQDLRLFDVHDCKPPGEILPYLNSVDITPGCPRDSTRVLLIGALPGCFHLVDVYRTPSPIVGPLPEPDVVIIQYAHDACAPNCPQVIQTWSAEIHLPPLPARNYQLMLQAQMLEIGCADSSNAIIGHATIPFTVANNCSTSTGGCFIAEFQPRRSGLCDATVGPDRPAQVTMFVSTSVPLAGLQGDLIFSHPGLRISKLDPTGPAAGMTLSWTRTATGARFVLFAPSGAPIPAVKGSPVLDVGVEAIPGVPIPELTDLQVFNAVASDINGVGVPLCPIITLDVKTGARICRSSPCDMNSDGIADVRDLIVMVHCVLDSASTSCPDPSRTELDCNRDGLKDINDVLCCARVILSGSRPDSVNGGRNAPEVTVAIDQIVPVAGGVDVALTVNGAPSLGAARLDLEYPSDRYEMTGVEMTGQATPGWLELHEAGSGRLAIGLIQVPQARDAMKDASSTRLPLVVHLQLRAGQTGGGDLRFTGGDFAGPDGAALATGARPIVLPLGDGSAVALGAAYPNPLRNFTRFALTLATAGDVDVAVFDLAGRRVATVFHGRVPAGTREFTWQRTGDDGRSVASGMYFYRAVAAGKVVSRKLMVLSRE